MAWLVPVLLAPFAGSFIGVLIRRLPAHQPVAWVRSACETCGAPLRARHLVPLASYAALRGRCGFCAAPIGRFHLEIELAALAVALWAAFWVRDPARLWAACVLGWALLALAWIDVRHLILPDVLTLPLLLLGLAVTLVLAPGAIAGHAIGAAAGYTAFRLIGWTYAAIRRRDGLGEGDAKLLAAAGAWLGWQALPLLVLIAASFGLLAAAAEILRGGRLHATSTIPFGPWLAAATWVLWLHGGMGGG